MTKDDKIDEEALLSSGLISSSTFTDLEGATEDVKDDQEKILIIFSSTF